MGMAKLASGGKWTSRYVYSNVLLLLCVKWKQVYRVTRDEVYQYKQKLNKYYYAGTSYGQSAASTIYILATVLERVDNDLLWSVVLLLQSKCH